MTPERFREITTHYPRLRIAVLGDFCLDRYLEIDPARGETSIETGLTVHNVVNVRAQPGAAGTILNNLVALGVGTLYPLGFAGEDGEGFELRRALAAKPGVCIDCFLTTPLRRTFTYCKPLVLEQDKPPRELSRLDSKNWTPTPHEVDAHFANSLHNLAGEIDALIVMDQVDLPETGVVTTPLLDTLRRLISQRPGLLIIADSRRSLRGYPPVCLKMNRAELSRLTGTATDAPLEGTGRTAASLAHSTGRPVFVSLSEQGLLAAAPSGEISHVPAHPTRGEIDIVGAGDAVMANLATALASGAAPCESIHLANAAASIVIHQLGTTGTATIEQIAPLMG